MPKFQAHISSPLKWTKTFTQSSLEDFSYKPGNEFSGGGKLLLRLVQNSALLIAAMISLIPNSSPQGEGS
ncbi:hypothetical protein AB3R30_05670 [Leptolyngbyaceae cyanobacterium UHCC 1019]